MTAFFIMFALALVFASLIIILLGGKARERETVEIQDHTSPPEYNDTTYPQMYSNISNWGELARSFDPDDTQQVRRF